MKYVLITPAKNEEVKISKTIESVVSQTILPSEWVIVSDGSTDKTDQIVLEYCGKYKFIRFIRNESHAGKDFSSKVNAFNKGLAILQSSDYSYIGNLDADVSFEKDYFEKILALMEQNRKLGIAGGHIYELYDGKVKPMKTSNNSVAGAVQLFRRDCFESIGGYIPIKIGGIDSAAEIYARYKGWEVQTYFELKVMHHGQVLTGKATRLMTYFQNGLARYRLGYHPLFHLIASLSRTTKPPIILGSVMYVFGYLSGALKKTEKVLPAEVVHHLQDYQLSRLRQLFLFNADK